MALALHKQNQVNQVENTAPNVLYQREESRVHTSIFKLSPARGEKIYVNSTISALFLRATFYTHVEH